MRLNIYLSVLGLSAIAASANASGLSEVQCTFDGTDYAVEATSTAALSSSATLSMSGTALAGPFTLSNSNKTISGVLASGVDCVHADTSVTDGSNSYTLD